MVKYKAHPATSKGFIVDWLVCGPFPKVGPHPSGRDSFYTDFLADAGGEANIKPKTGLSHSSSCVESGSVQWKEYTAEQNGFVNFVELYGEPFAEFWRLKGGVAYAYTTIQCNEPKRAVFLLGSEDSAMVWLNRRLVHHNKIGRSLHPGQDIFVADLEKGVNRLLVKVARYGGGWGFYLQRFDPEGKIFVNKAGAIIPNLRVGQKLSAWASIPLINTTKERIKNVRIRVFESNLFNSSLNETGGLAPGEWRRVPLWISTRREVGPDEDSELAISVEADGEIQRESLGLTTRRREEWFITTYRSKVDGSIQPYGLYIPTSYDKDRPYPLIVVLHGYKGGWAIGAYALKEWCIMAGVYARGEVPYRDIGEQDVFEVIEAVKERYNIDKDRICLTGHSMGGSGTWYLGLHKPDVWAAIAPLSAGTDYRLRMERLIAAGEEVPKWLWALIDENSPMYLVENALNLPTFVSHGSDDKIVHVEHSRRIVAALKELGYTVEYDEVSGKGHTWGPQGRPWWGNECMDRPMISNFFHKYRRRRYPRKVHYKTNLLRFNRAYWVEIDEMDEVYRTARITAEVHEGNVVQVKTENVLQYTLSLVEELGIAMDKPLTVISNGFKARIEHTPMSRKVTLRAIHNGKGEETGYLFLLNPEEAEKVDEFEVWARLSEEGMTEVLYNQIGGNGLKKRPSLFGPIIDTFNSPFILIWGTRGDGTEVEANKKAAYGVATWWKAYANGDCIVKADTEVTVRDILRYNLVLFGDPETNVLIEKIKGGLPIKFEEGSIHLGPQKFTGDNLSLIMIYPNPLNMERYVLLNASATAEGMENFKKLYNGWMMLPDYAIFNGTIVEKGLEGYLAAGFFDKNWQLPR